MVLGYGLWQRLYAGRDDAIGSELRVNGVPHTVDRRAAARLPLRRRRGGFWLPLAFTAEDRADDQRHSNNYQMVARLRPAPPSSRPGSSCTRSTAANLERSPSCARLLLDAGYTTAGDAAAGAAGARRARPLYLLWGGCALRALDRLRQRRQPGAGARHGPRARAGGAAGARRRAVAALRQLLVESLLLTLAGRCRPGSLLGVPGVLRWPARRRYGEHPARQRDRARRGDARAGRRRSPASLGLAAGAASRCPTARAPTLAPHAARGGPRRHRQPRRALAAAALVAAQVAFAFVLLLGAGLLLASFDELLRVRPGSRRRACSRGKVSLPAAVLPRGRGRCAAWTPRALRARPRAARRRPPPASPPRPFAGNYSDNVILAEGYVPARASRCPAGADRR